MTMAECLLPIAALAIICTLGTVEARGITSRLQVQVSAENLKMKKGLQELAQRLVVLGKAFLEVTVGAPRGFSPFLCVQEVLSTMRSWR